MYIPGFSKKEEVTKYTYWYEPKEDITTYELAQLIPYLIPGISKKPMQERLKLLDEKTLRHITKKTESENK